MYTIQKKKIKEATAKRAKIRNSVKQNNSKLQLSKRFMQYTIHQTKR